MVGRDGKGREGRKGERVVKGEGGLDLDICSGSPEFLVTPLPLGLRAANNGVLS